MPLALVRNLATSWRHLVAKFLTDARISNNFMLTKFASYKLLPVMVSTHGSVVPLAMFLYFVYIFSFKKCATHDNAVLADWALSADQCVMQSSGQGGEQMSEMQISTLCVIVVCCIFHLQLSCIVLFCSGR